MTALNHELCPHSLQHTQTSILTELGFELIEIMDLLGHTKDETTVNVYLHVTNGKKKETPNKFSELIRGLR
ncbi:tyrosine-type recombinase/integrase [Bacillus sp. FJAT-45350]|uniref:tyrosine-type recombinase/integrase n=1 Tax=Bacillus sp. FJAT-45350 TaxID=2011014 RepID=UPI000BB6D465|nr:tyrosine-type recombinase/integrase [Bacillus sp. FJAT-45350]